MGTLHGLHALDRFLAKVDRDDLGPGGDCWHWTGAVQSRGYGVFTVKRSQRHPADPELLGCWLAHRFALRWIAGEELDPELTVDHLCENKLCVNPAHLEQVTREENGRRAHYRIA